MTIREYKQGDCNFAETEDEKFQGIGLELVEKMTYFGKIIRKSRNNKKFGCILKKLGRHFKE